LSKPKKRRPRAKNAAKNAARPSERPRKADTRQKIFLEEKIPRGNFSRTRDKTDENFPLAWRGARKIFPAPAAPLKLKATPGASAGSTLPRKSGQRSVIVI
jgi:hypothetical protein